MIKIVEVLEATASGTRKYLNALVAALPPGEFDVRIVCSTRRDPTYAEDIDHFRAQGRRVIVLPMTRAAHPILDPVACLRLRRILAREPCDVLHLHSAKAGFLGRLAAWEQRCKVIYSPHAFPFLQRTAAPLRALYRLAERLTSARTDLLLAVGSAEARLAVESALFPASKVRVLENAVDVAELEREVARQPRLGADGAPVVGFLGELRPQKDPLTFLAAARLLRERLPEVRYVMPAWGGLLPAVRRQIRRDRLGDRVELVPREGVLLPYYHGLSLAVQCSLWEGLPYTLLEALALRVPVVGSDIPPVAELLADVAPRFLFPPGRADRLADLIEESLGLSEPGRAALVERGRARIERHHLLENWGSGVRALYRSLAPPTA